LPTRLALTQAADARPPSTIRWKPLVMALFDTIHQGGTVIDGMRSGRLSLTSVSWLDGSRPSAVSMLLTPASADAAGLIVGQGLSDLHTHYDSSCSGTRLLDSRASTVHVGGDRQLRLSASRPAKCGPGADHAAMPATSRACDACKKGCRGNWETFPSLIARGHTQGCECAGLRTARPAVHVCDGARQAKSRRPTADVNWPHVRLLGVAMEAGACGFSTPAPPAPESQRDYDCTPMITDTMAEETFLPSPTLRK